MRTSSLRSSAAALGAILALSARAQSQFYGFFQEGAQPTNRYTGARDVLITPQRDDDKDPSANYASRQELRVDGFPARLTSLLAFPLNGGELPSTGITINGVALVLSARDGTSTGAAVYEVLRPWEEGEATYLRPSSGERWSEDGAAGPGTDRAVAPLARVAQVSSGGNQAVIPLAAAGVDLVRRWFTGTSPNHGLAIQDFDSWDELRFDSSEGTNPPALVVSYTGPTGTEGTATIHPGADTMLSYQPPNYDGWGLGLAGKSGAEIASLVRWDVRAIPPGAKVLAATMGLKMDRIGSVQPTSILAATRPWTESADWDRYDGVNAWERSGAQGGADHGDVLDTMPACGAFLGCSIALLGSINTIQGWVDKPGTNMGFLIQRYGTLDEAQMFDSETPDPASRPALAVRFVWERSDPAVWPAYAEVSTEDSLQVLLMGPPTIPAARYDVVGESTPSITTFGLYTAGRTPGRDLVSVTRLDGKSALAVVDVYPRDGGPGPGAGADGGTGNVSLFASIALASEEDGVVDPRQALTINATIRNLTTLAFEGLTLSLAPTGLAFTSDPAIAGSPLQAASAGFSLPPLAGGATIQVSLPVKVVAIPSVPPSLTASVNVGGTPLVTASLPFELAPPGTFDTGTCACGAGPGGVTLAVVALALARVLRARERSRRSRRSRRQRI